MYLSWRGKEIVNTYPEHFLDTNGAHQETKVAVDIPSRKDSILVREASDRCQRKMAGDIKRSECVLTERSCGNV